MKTPEYFLIADPAQLRRKVASFSGLWSQRWKHFLAQAGAETRTVRWYGGGPDRPMHAVLAWVVTQDPKWGEVARKDLLWMRDTYDELLKVGAQDLDTWCHSAPMLRRAVALDWLWESGTLTDDEKAGLCELFIRDALSYPYVVMHHRVPAHANNQGLSMALSMVVVGYLFGVRRAQDPRAIHLLEFALPHLHQQIALLPPGGYSGEGSTYVVQVADPLMALACAVLEEISGREYLDLKFAPSGNSAAGVLYLNSKLVPPSGLLPAWDQHGYHLQKAGATAAYLAQRTGDAAGYYPYLFGDGWELSESFAWLRDDHVWQLVWMPDPAEEAQPLEGAHCYPRSWAEDHVAGALLDKRAQMHLFQMWDVSGPRPIRGHMNPNSILLEAWGSVLTVDGNATRDFPLDSDSRMRFVHWALEVPDFLSWAFGSLGAHSVITVDGVVDHTSPAGDFDNSPDTVVTGRLLRREERPGFQLIAAEVAPFYSNRFDVISMIRSSSLVGDAFWVVIDQISAKTEHDYLWQLVMRAGAQPTTYGARLITAEHVVLDVFHLDGCASELVDIPGYPALLELRSHHLQKSLRGANAEFITALVPQLARKELADWTESWRGIADPQEQGAREDYQHADGSEWEAFTLTDVLYKRAGVNLPHCKDESSVWLTRECQIPPLAGEGALLLELPRSYGCRLWLDGVEQDVPPLATTHHNEPRLQAPFVDVTAALRDKQSTRVTLLFSKQGSLGVTGGVKLHQSISAEVPDVRIESSGDLHVTFGGSLHVVDLDEIRTSPSCDIRPCFHGEDPLEIAAELVNEVCQQEQEIETLMWKAEAKLRASACVLALKHPLEDVEEQLLAAVRDEDWIVRLLAARALGVHRSRNAVPVLRRIVSEETPERISASGYLPRYRLKEMAIYALGLIGDPAAAGELAGCLVAEDFYGVRRLAAEALGRLGDPTVLEALDHWTEDSDPETKAAARRSAAILRAMPMLHST